MMTTNNKYSSMSNKKWNHFSSSEADVFKIRFVRILDLDLAGDFSLTKLPALVYFRNEIPVVFEGDLKDEAEVLEWLIQHQTSIDEEDVVENASKVSLIPHGELCSTEEVFLLPNQQTWVQIPALPRFFLSL